MATTAAAAVASSSQVSIQDFLKILVTQLNNQDPLKPLDNQEFVTQLAQFTSLQQTQELNDKLGSLLSIQGAMQSVGLLGRTIDITPNGGGSATGTVTALGFTAGEPRLTVRLDNGSVLTDVSLSSLVTVR
jgi:flagellar basal-body rod modification protein FlgD